MYLHVNSIDIAVLGRVRGISHLGIVIGTIELQQRPTFRREMHSFAVTEYRIFLSRTNCRINFLDLPGKITFSQTFRYLFGPVKCMPGHFPFPFSLTLSKI